MQRRARVRLPSAAAARISAVCFCAKSSSQMSWRRRLGNDVPFHRFLGSAGRAPAGGEDAREPVLRDRAPRRAAFCSRTAAARFVLCDAGAVIAARSQYSTCASRWSAKRRGAPAGVSPRLRPSVRRGPPCSMVASAYCASGLPALRGLAKQFGGAREVLRELLGPRDRAGRDYRPRRRGRAWRRGEQLRCLVAVLRDRRARRCRNIASANMASRSPRSAASRYHSAALASSCWTPKPLP